MQAVCCQPRREGETALEEGVELQERVRGGQMLMKARHVGERVLPSLLTSSDRPHIRCCHPT